MEHRTNERLEIDLMAEVSRNGRTVGLFKVKDIGNGGMCLVDEDGELSLYDFIGITLESSTAISRQDRQPQALHALVVQSGFQTAGAMWALGQIDVSYLLQGLGAVAA